MDAPVPGKKPLSGAFRPKERHSGRVGVGTLRPEMFWGNTAPEPRNVTVGGAGFARDSKSTHNRRGGGKVCGLVIIPPLVLLAHYNLALPGWIVGLRGG